MTTLVLIWLLFLVHAQVGLLYGSLEHQGLENQILWQEAPLWKTKDKLFLISIQAFFGLNGL